MNVLMFLCCLNSAGGVEQYVISIVPALQKLGVNVIVCVEEPPSPQNQYYQELQSKGISVHYPHLGPFPIYGWSWHLDALLLLFFPLTIAVLLLDGLFRSRGWRRSYAGLRGRLNNWMRPFLPAWLCHIPLWVLLTWLWLRYRFQVFHVLRADSVGGLKWGLTLKRPTIYTEASEPGGEVYFPYIASFYWELEPLVPQIPVVITQSERVRRAIQSRWHATDNVYVLPWVVDGGSAVQEIGNQRENGAVVFGSAGRLSPEKSVETFLEAAKLLVKEYQDCVRFVVAGGGSAEHDLKRYAESLGIENRVLFTGPYTRPLLPQVFAMFDVFVISSLTEGAPLAVMEAMAYAKPVVATDVAGTGELIQEGVTGFLVKPGDPDALAKACARFVAEPELIAVMGHQAFDNYQLRFTPEVGAKQLLELYSQLLKGSFSSRDA